MVTYRCVLCSAALDTSLWFDTEEEMDAHYSTTVHLSSRLSTGTSKFAEVHRGHLQTFRNTVLKTILKMGLIGVEFSHYVESSYRACVALVSQ